MGQLKFLLILRFASLGSRVSLLVVTMIAGACLAAQSVGGRGPQTHVQAVSLKKDLSDVQIQKAADALLAFAIVPSGKNQYFPKFAKEKIAWFATQAEAGSATVILLKDLSKTNLGADDLMASTVVDGRHTIIISEPRFVRFLVEGGAVSSPFGEQQENDFMLGLVHEIVHLQGPGSARAPKGQDRIREESRTWREVSLNVVRHLRRLGKRMHPKFVRVDEALRSCGDLLPCSPFIGAVFR